MFCIYLHSSSRTGWPPFRNIHLSNGNIYFSLFRRYVLSSITKNTFTGLDYKMLHGGNCEPFGSTCIHSWISCSVLFIMLCFLFCLSSFCTCAKHCLCFWIVHSVFSNAIVNVFLACIWLKYCSHYVKQQRLFDLFVMVPGCCFVVQIVKVCIVPSDWYRIKQRTTRM